MTWSIRRRLLTWLLSGILLSGIAATAAIYLQARDEADEVFDRQLKQIALSLRTQEDLSATPADAEDEEEDYIAVSAWDRTGKPVLGFARGRPAPPYGSNGYHTELRQQQTWRVYVATGSAGTVEAAQPLVARAKFALGMVGQILLPVAGLMVVLIALVCIGVGRGLKPLSDMTGLLAARSGVALEPVGDARQPKEVIPFISALNGLLARLRQESTKQKYFVADAAHELRTPLQALRLQLELVDCAQDDAERAAALTRLRGGIDRLTHLTQQLLTMARLDPQALPAALYPVNLSEVAVAVIGELWPLAKAKDIDLGSVTHTPVVVQGEAEALRIMLTNIVDNAIRYTPCGGRVDINIHQLGPSVELEVVDTGSGIPVQERDRVFDRFYRGVGQSANGSGLGLAIVKSLAERYHTRIALQEGSEGRGLRFCLFLEASA
jgi:two-component system OmpR family sensor kinase